MLECGQMLHSSHHTFVKKSLIPCPTAITFEPFKSDSGRVQVDLGSVAKGIYLVKFTSGGMADQQRIVVE